LGSIFNQALANGVSAEEFAPRQKHSDHQGRPHQQLRRKIQVRRGGDVAYQDDVHWCFEANTDRRQRDNSIPPATRDSKKSRRRTGPDLPLLTVNPRPIAGNRLRQLTTQVMKLTPHSSICSSRFCHFPYLQPSRSEILRRVLEVVFAKAAESKPVVVEVKPE